MLTIGDEVKVTLKPSDNRILLVVGTMAYSEDGRCVLVADYECVGMPINVKWLDRTGESFPELAVEYRERYLAKFPATLK